MALFCFTAPKKAPFFASQLLSSEQLTTVSTGMRTGTLTVEDQKPACFIVHEELIYNSDADYVHNKRHLLQVVTIN